MSAARAKRRQDRLRGPAARAPQHDRGADGPAALCRPCRPVETAVAGVLATQTLDGHLIDHMHNISQLSDRQYEVALRLLEMFNAAGLECAGSAQWGRIGHGGDMPDEMAQARSAWNRLMSKLGHVWPCRIEAMCHGQHPGIWRMTETQEALTWLADRWGMAR